MQQTLVTIEVQVLPGLFLGSIGAAQALTARLHYCAHFWVLTVEFGQAVERLHELNVS